MTAVVAKPAVAALLQRSLNAQHEAKTVVSQDNAELLADFSRTGLVGCSPAMVQVYKRITHAARTEATVLVQSDVWRRLFVSASALAVTQARQKDMILYPDRFGRLLNGDGIFVPNGRSKERPTD